MSPAKESKEISSEADAQINFSNLILQIASEKNSLCERNQFSEHRQGRQLDQGANEESKKDFQNLKLFIVFEKTPQGEKPSPQLAYALNICNKMIKIAQYNAFLILVNSE